LAHIPSGGGSCYKPWSREYRRIIDRFHMTISAQFNGHTHLDEFNVFYSSSDARHAVNVAWNGGGATPFHFVNPNYIMYYVDRQQYVSSW
jgi:sphingomyelin phosphodiesterase